MHDIMKLIQLYYDYILSIKISVTLFLSIVPIPSLFESTTNNY